MPWYQNIVPESIKKNVCAYLLQRYLGQFIEEKVTRDQLNVDLYNGTGSVENIKLDVQVLNELSEKQNWPMEFVDGYIESLHISMPWTSLLKDSSYVEVRGMKITLQPKQRHESATSMFESMWNSMTSSIQLAEECAKQDAMNAVNSAQPYEGIEIFAQAIESILSRVKVKFIDTTLQIEHVPKDSSTGVGIIMNIDSIEYFDEAGNDPPSDEATDLSTQDSKKAYLVQSFTTKRFIIQGVTFSSVEFPSRARTFSRSLLAQSQNGDKAEEEEESFITMFEKNSLNETGEEVREEKAAEGEETGENLNEECSSRHVVVFGKLSSRQEIRVKIKQPENVVGPKVSIDMNFGSLILFLSPRQFHVLVELANGLASPDIQDTSNVPPRPKCVQKPMTGLDYERVEQELQQQLNPYPSYQVGGLQGAQGWSTAPLDESDMEDNFLPMKNAVSGMYDSALSGVSSSMDSSVNSSLGSSITDVTSRTRRRINNIETDPTAEISHFQIRISSVALILLHEDVLVQPTSKEDVLAPSSVQQLKRISGDFFARLDRFVLSRDFEGASVVFDSACTLSHLRLLAAPVQIEADEKTTSSAFSITATLTAAKLQLTECLYVSECPLLSVPLLSFVDGSAQAGSPIGVKPNLKLNFKHVEKTSRRVSMRRNSGPKSDVMIYLSKCTLEFDITIIDRITAILNPPVICQIEKPKYNPWTMGTAIPELSPINPLESKLDLKVTSPAVTVKLRFPITDFRPMHDMNRIPWWKRHIRPDYLSIVLMDATFQTTFQTDQAFQDYQLQSRGLDVFYHGTENDKVGLPIAKAGFDDKFGASMQDVLLQSRLLVKIFHKKPLDLEEPESEPEAMTMSFYGTLGLQNSDRPSPFSSKRVVHESDTPHPKPQKQNSSDEIVIPGDKAEIEEFIKSASSSCKVHIEIFLPTVSLQLQSKHVYELIYNRINNDLLLWEPSAPVPKSESYDSNYQGLSNLDKNVIIEGQTVFSMCKSGIQYESDSDSDDCSENGSSNIFYSTFGSKLKEPAKTPASSVRKSTERSNVVLSFRIGQGLAVLNPPVRDVSTNNVIPGQQGEFLLNVEDVNIFVVTGYQGDSDLGYVCVQVHNAQLYHCDMTSIPSQSPPIKDIGSMVGKHLHPTIYRSESGMMACSKNRGGDREMLTISLKIQASHETHHVKIIQVVLGVNKGTLRHRMCNEPNSWISQLLDFFNVNDYPVPGYHAKDVLTELHLHLWDCAIDYRPLYLPIRSAITIGNFSMSSHLSAQANSSTLRFIFEECCLFLSEKAQSRSASVDLQRDYVNVIEMGLLELSLKINDKKSGLNPHIDLRVSNNILNIHTCFDSCRMLMQLITYFANDGDIENPSLPEPAPGSFSSPLHRVEQELISVEPQNISNLSKSQHEHVNSLLGEAMEDDETEKSSEPAEGLTGAQLFFFPDERQLNQLEPLSKPLPQVTCELGDVAFHVNNRNGSDTDDEFCIIGNEPGLGLFPRNGLPEIKWLTSDPIRVVDNHFAIPVDKADLLKPPKHYPTPVMRYTLCDMTVVWHMYGGNDFKVAEDENKKKSVNFSDTQLDDRVSFSNVDRNRISFTSSSDRRKAKMHWMARGGVNRDYDVHMELQFNKVRFQHEQYPETSTQASRQVVIISEVEIRDRLQSSQINKFLYQYTSQAMPKQSHANMIVVKAVHIRPDPRLSTQECCLKVSLMPLRLNIDQDSLLFLINFFNELSGNSSADDHPTAPSSSKHNTPTHRPPVMTVGVENEDQLREEACKAVNDNLILLMEDKRTEEEPSSPASTGTNAASSDGAPIYFRNVIFAPDVPIRLDYHGKRVDMTHGPLPGLLMGLGQLNCSEIRLKRISYRHGLLGFDKLVAHLLQEWLNDIKKNQLPSLLGGVGPMYSLVQLFQGVRDLFWLPIEQYQKDGRIVRGLQRGANSFTTSTAMAALELTSRLIHLIQITAETAYDMLSPGPSLRRLAKSKGKKRRYHQPQDIREGMTNAIMLVKEGIGETADNIVQVAAIEKEQKGYPGAVGGVLRQIPPTILKPIILASEATSNVLGGMRSQLVPDARREANQKWRSDES